MAKNIKPKGYKVPPLSRADVFVRADKLRSDFGMSQTLYFDIVRFIESILPMCDSDFDFKVVEDHELPHQLALTLPDKKLMVVRHSVYRGAVGNCGRDRFTLAHEVGHYILHPGVPASYAKDGSHEYYQDSEWQANNFAGELLAPIYLLDGMGTIQISEDFGVSHTTANIQRDHATKRKAATSSGRLTLPQGCK